MSYYLLSEVPKVYKPCLPNWDRYFDGHNSASLLARDLNAAFQEYDRLREVLLLLWPIQWAPGLRRYYHARKTALEKVASRVVRLEGRL